MNIMMIAFIGNIEGALLIIFSLIFQFVCFLIKNKNYYKLIKAIFNVGAIMSCISTITASIVFLLYILIFYWELSNKMQKKQEIFMN